MKELLYAVRCLKSNEDMILQFFHMILLMLSSFEWVSVLMLNQLRDIKKAVSYTHLTLPTKLEV